MSETVAVALITNVTIIIVALLSRLWSHREHRDTAAKVSDTNKKVTQIVNGQATEKGIPSQ